jgi:hypothetical protein
MALEQNLVSLIGIIIILYLGFKIIKNIIYTGILIIGLIVALWYFGFLPF